MMKFVAPMDTWEMVGGNLPPIRVRARSFDEALKSGMSLSAQGATGINNPA